MQAKKLGLASGRKGPRAAKVRLGVVAFEQHFSPKELAALWGFNPTTVRRMFEGEPGVLEVGKSQRRDGKRDYVSLRIPESVALRVYQKHCR